MKTIQKKVVILSLYVLILQWQTWSHIPGGGTGGGAFGGSGAGRSFSGVSIYNLNDSVKVAFDFYGNLSYSVCSDLNQGEPLGPGGWLSNMYNAFLYTEFTSLNVYPYRSDYILQQQDFGYTPLWQPNSISGRVHYRFLPNVWGTMTMDCNLDGLVDNVRNIANYIRFGELSVKWAPKFVKNFSTTIGKVHVGGTYIPIFDQMPLENFLFNGVIMDYSRDIKNKVFLSGRIAAGQEFLGRSVWYSDTSGSNMTLFGNVDKIRNRNHLFVKAQIGYKRKLGAKFIGGYQVIPEDTTQVLYSGLNYPLTRTLYHPRSTGWHIGMELAFNTKITNHIGVISYSKGDVRTGWGSPYFINKPDNGGVTDWYDSSEFIPDFTMEGSELTYGVYWANFNYKRIMLDLGISGFWQNPEKHPVTYSFDNSHWEDSAGYTIWVHQIDTLTLKAQDFKALKGAVKASFSIVKPLRIGVRYDEIHFFNPGAHTNSPELGVGFADPMDPSSSTFKMLYNKSAKWEREAVNTRIITPFLSVELAKLLRIRAAYAFAFYEKPIIRQSRLSDRHGNFSLGATVTYRFAKLPE